VDCPACHQPGTAVDAPEARRPLFACESPDCIVETFDAEGAQSVEAPGAERPSEG
jgi:hypothetical protein